MTRRPKSVAYPHQRRAQLATVRRLAAQFYQGQVPDDFDAICHAEGVDSHEVSREMSFLRQLPQAAPAPDPSPDKTDQTP